MLRKHRMINDNNWNWYQNITYCQCWEHRAVQNNDSHGRTFTRRFFCLLIGKLALTKHSGRGLAFNNRCNTYTVTSSYVNTHANQMHLYMAHGTDNVQPRHSCRASLHVISTTVTLCWVASQTVCSGAYSLCRTRQRDSSPVLVDVTTSHQSWGNSTGFQSDNESSSSWPSWSTRRCMMQLQHILYTTASLSLTPAVAGSDRPTSTRAAFHWPTHGSAIGASQPLDHGSGTVCQPGFANPTTT